MNKKNRLFEVFNKVNGLVLNENVNQYDDIDEYIDSIKSDIVDEFKSNNVQSLFNENSFPTTITINYFGNDNNPQKIVFILNENKPLELENFNDGQLKYTIFYSTKGENFNQLLNNYSINLEIPLFVNVENNYGNNTINFELQTFIDNNHIELFFNKEE